MARIRRVIRRVQPARGPAFDEQFWPVILAMFVLGGFLVGTTLAYMDFNDPRWYANAWTWLFAIPIFVCGTLVVLRHVENRAIRRGVQLSAVLGVLVHVILVIVCYETNVFSRFFDPQNVTRAPERERIVARQYEPFQLDPQQRRQAAVNRPLETETPDPTPAEEVPREEVEPETPRQPTPTPAPQPEPVVEPNLSTRREVAQATPRQSEQASQLSRQIAEVKPQPREPVAVPQPNTPSRSQAAPVESQGPSLARQPAPAAAERPLTAEAPAQATADQPQVELTRRTTTDARNPVSAATPQLERAIARPVEVPKTSVAAADTPSPSRQTEPSQLRPNAVAVRRQQSTSPATERRIAEPAPQTPPEITPTERRQNPAEPAPAIASAPRPVPNERSRLTPRPDVATVAANTGENPSRSAESRLEATPSPLSRQSVAAATARPTDAQPASETSAMQPSESSLRRTTRAETPATNAADAAPRALARAEASSAAPSARTTADQVAATVSQPQTGELSPSSMATRRQAASEPQVSPNSGEPSPTSIATEATVASAGTQRRATSSQAPQMTPSTSTLARRADAAAQPTANNATASVDVPTTTSRSGGAEPSAAATAIARQATASPTADRSAAAGEPSTATEGIQLATRSTRRANAAADEPSLSAAPTGQAGSPARSTPTPLAANLAAAGPPSATAETGAGQPSMQPSRTALTRSLQGVSGVGQSANFDRALAASESPSLVSSGSARRAEATTNQPQGAALAPSSPALTRQALAGADRPSATLQATPNANSPLLGAAQPAELNASASASLTRADAAATTADTTAARGVADVDVGPTRIVDEGGISRASGGGQPVLSPANDAPALARAALGGGAAPPALDARAELPSSAAGDGGGVASSAEIAPAPMLARRGEGGGEPANASTAAGLAGPAESGDPTADVGMTASSRAGSEASRDAAALAAASAGGDEDEEERQRKLARAALGGAPRLAMSAPNVATDVTAPADALSGVGTAAGQAESAPMEAGTGDVARAEAAAAPMATGSATSSMGEPAVAAGGGEVVGSALVRRAEAADASPGLASLGGGTATPARTLARPDFAAAMTAPQVALPGAAASSGAPDGQPLEAQSDTPSPSDGGFLARAESGPVGAAAGDVPADGVGEGIDPGPAELARATRQADGPLAGDASVAGAPFPRAATPRLNAGPVTDLAADLPLAASSSAGGQGDGDLLAASSTSPMSRQAAGAIPIDVSEVEGPGGVGSEVTMDVGIASRRASLDSLRVQTDGPRFARSDVGGLPSMNTGAVVAAEPFRARQLRMNGESSGGSASGAGPQTEEAIERGLAFLARYQLQDGSWSLQSFNEDVALVSDTAATALALLAFQGAGYNHREYKYAKTVEGGVRFLVKNQQPDGNLFIPLDDRSNASVWLYSHAIAAIALCEAYGMTQDPELREPAQKAIDFIVSSQHPTRGGWRYSPQAESDTSVTGWMMMALKSAQLANLDVPPESLTLIKQYLDAAQGTEGQRHLYRYNPYAPDTPDKRHGRLPSKTMTAVGLLMRLYAGWKRDHPSMVRGADYLREHLPADGTSRDPQRDTYYWYYATQLMFHMGGDYWDEWNGRLHPLLVNSQVARGNMAGSWDPRSPVADAWAPHAGRLYVTTMNLLSLEVTYRHLPLYEETAR